MKRLQAGLSLLKSDVYELRFALLGIGVYYLIVNLIFGAFCPLVILADFPCPGCGMTRAVFRVLSGRFAGAFYLQPAVYGWLALGLGFAWERYGAGRKPSKLTRICLAAVLLFTIAVYVWRLFYGFPPELIS